MPLKRDFTPIIAREETFSRRCLGMEAFKPNAVNMELWRSSMDCSPSVSESSPVYLRRDNCTDM